MPKIVLAMAAADDRSGLLLLAIWAVLVLAGGMGAVDVVSLTLPSPYGDILFIAAAICGADPDFSDRRVDRETRSQPGAVAWLE